MDPLADKLLVTAALLVLVEMRVLPSWVALIIISREFIVSGIRMVAASEGVVIAASWWGKVKTVTQIVAIVLFLVKKSPLFGSYNQDFSNWLYIIAWACMAVAVFFTIVSMLDYFMKARALLGFSEEAHKVKPDGGDDAEMQRRSLEVLAAQVINEARATGKRIGTAESCTGGLIGATLTAVPGSSDVVEGGIVSYSNEVKMRRLGVSADTLDAHGAVSEETACAMAEGARRELGVDAAVSVTGIAGPGGAVPGKPVGTVWIGICDGDGPRAMLFNFEGDRDQVRLQSVNEALLMLQASLGR
jgi:PncC family amidohydrolase